MDTHHSRTYVRREVFVYGINGDRWRVVGSAGRRTEDTRPPSLSPSFLPSVALLVGVSELSGLCPCDRPVCAHSPQWQSLGVIDCLLACCVVALVGCVVVLLLCCCVVVLLCCCVVGWLVVGWPSTAETWASVSFVSCVDGTRV